MTKITELSESKEMDLRRAMEKNTKPKARIEGIEELEKIEQIQQPKMLNLGPKSRS